MYYKTLLLIGSILSLDLLILITMKYMILILIRNILVIGYKVHMSEGIKSGIYIYRHAFITRSVEKNVSSLILKSSIWL